MDKQENVPSSVEEQLKELQIDQEEQDKKSESQQRSENGDFYDSNEEFFIDSVRLGDVDDVKDVLKDKVDITYFDRHINNALHMIAGNGHKELFEIIFAYIKENNWSQEQINKFINQQNADGQTPVHFGTICGQKEIVQLLCEKGANCNIQNKVGHVPLEEAIELEQYEIGEILAKFTKEDMDKYQDVEDYQVAASKEDQKEMIDAEEEHRSNTSNSSK